MKLEGETDCSLAWWEKPASEIYFAANPRAAATRAIYRLPLPRQASSARHRIAPHRSEEMQPSQDGIGCRDCGSNSPDHREEQRPLKNGMRSGCVLDRCGHGCVSTALQFRPRKNCWRTVSLPPGDVGNEFLI
jgi:hypothetical protein